MPMPVLPGGQGKDTLAVIKYSVVDAVIAEKRKLYAGLKVTDNKSYETVRVAVADLRGMRTGTEEERKALKASALDWGRRVDARAKEITSQVAAIEDPLKAELRAWDDKKEKEREERARKEKERIDKIKEMLFTMERMVTTAGKTADEIAVTYAKLMDMRFEPEVYQEFFDEAVRVHAHVVETIERLYAERLAFEEEQKAQQVEKARLAEEARRIEDEKKKLAPAHTNGVAETKVEVPRTTTPPAAPPVCAGPAENPGEPAPFVFPRTATLTLYAHMDPEYLLEKAQEHGMGDEAANYFRHFEEISIEADVNLDTGEVTGCRLLNW